MSTLYELTTDLLETEEEKQQRKEKSRYEQRW